MSLQRVGVRQKQTVVAVFPETTAGNRAFSMLEAAAADLKSTVVERIPFERLDFGATDVLDKFYSANVVVVDVTERSYQATMFYQLGLRESFDMKHNVVTCVDQQSAFTGRRGSVNPDALSSSSAIGLLCANFTYVPYYTTQDGNCLSNEGVGTDALSTQPLTLHKRLKHVLQDMHRDYRRNHKEMFFKHLRNVRESKRGEELKQELKKLRGWIDGDPKLFAADVLLSLLLSYRDIQVQHDVSSFCNIHQLLLLPLFLWILFTPDRTITPWWN